MTTADFIDVGTSLDLSVALMMSVIVGSSSFLASLMIQVGIGPMYNFSKEIYI